MMRTNAQRIPRRSPEIARLRALKIEVEEVRAGEWRVANSVTFWTATCYWKHDDGRHGYSFKRLVDLLLDKHALAPV